VRVELHDENWAELRDNLTGGDRRRAKAAIEITIGGDESRRFTAELEDRINYALLRQLIVSWSFPQTLPRNAASVEVADQILDDMDLGDIEALAAAIKPMYDRVLNGPKGRNDSGKVLSITSLDDPEPGSPSRTT
jgi:hypothetical protein